MVFIQVMTVHLLVWSINDLRVKIYIYICHIRTVYSPETRHIRKIITYRFEYVNNHLNGPHSDSIHRIQANCIRVLAAGVFQFEGTSAYIYVNQMRFLTVHEIYVTIRGQQQLSDSMCTLAMLPVRRTSS